MRKCCKYSLKMYKTFSVNRAKISLKGNVKIFSKISSKFIYQAKEVWFVGFYWKMSEIYKKEKKKKNGTVYK